MAEAPGLGIVAGTGALPRMLAEAEAEAGRPYRVILFGDEARDWTDAHPLIRVPFEKPGRLFAELRSAGCGRIVFAGWMGRPRPDPLRFDLTALRLAARILPALRGGDDALLRVLAETFEGAGFEMVAPHALLEGLVQPAGVPTRAAPGDADRADAARAEELVAAIGAVDVGQAAVVGQGLCLGLESIAGTDALLDYVAATRDGRLPDPEGALGLLFKAPKPGQDWRVDLPAIGPETVTRAAAAGLGGIVVEAGGVLILAREEVVARADAAGLFLWVREPGG